MPTLTAETSSAPAANGSSDPLMLWVTAQLGSLRQEQARQLNPAASGLSGAQHCCCCCDGAMLSWQRPAGPWMVADRHCCCSPLLQLLAAAAGVSDADSLRPWELQWEELQILRRIGEGSFGKASAGSDFTRLCCRHCHDASAAATGSCVWAACSQCLRLAALKVCPPLAALPSLLTPVLPRALGVAWRACRCTWRCGMRLKWPSRCFSTWTAGTHLRCPTPCSPGCTRPVWMGSQGGRRRGGPPLPNCGSMYLPARATSTLPSASAAAAARVLASDCLPLTACL